MRKISAWVCISLLGWLTLEWSRCWADDPQPLFLGARARAMGGAFTAIADDDTALYFNPAGLAGLKKYSFHLVTLDAETSNDLISDASVADQIFSASDLTTLNNLVGKNYSMRGQGSTTITVPGFGIGFLYDRQGSVRMKDVSFIQGIIGSQATYGVQAGFGVPIIQYKKKSGELRFGLATKLLWREGGSMPVDMSQLSNLNYSAIQHLLPSLGTGYGIDMGVQSVVNFKKRFTWFTGIAATDLGGTKFSSGAATQPMNLTAGLGLRYTGPDVIATLSYDYSQITDSIHWLKKNHVGTALDFSFFSLYAGMNQLSVTYGMGFDFWLVNLMALSYGDDQATLAGQDVERRTLVHLGFKMDL